MPGYFPSHNEPALWVREMKVMSNYSGSTSFEFEVERYVSPKDGSLLTSDQVSDDDPDVEYKIVKLNVEGSSYFQAGKHYGPPENCYPDEGDTEITKVVDTAGKDWSDLLTEEEKNSILNLINEGVQNDEPDFDFDEPDCEPDDWSF